MFIHFLVCIATTQKKTRRKVKSTQSPKNALDKIIGTIKLIFGSTPNEKKKTSIASCKREWVSNTPTGLVDHSSFANCSRSLRFEGSLPHCWFEIPPQVFRIQIWTHCWPFQNSPALCLLPFIVLFEVCCTPKLFGNHQISWYYSHSQDIQCRGLHGLKMEARTWPVPEIVWPDPSGTVKFRAQTRNIFPPTTNSKEKKKGCISRLHATVSKQRNRFIKAWPFHEAK